MLCSGEQSAGSARLQTDLSDWSGKHLNPTIHVHVFSSHVYSGGDPIKPTHEPFTDANVPRMSKIHTCVLSVDFDHLWRKAGPVDIKGHSKVSQIIPSWTPVGLGYNGSRAWKPWEWTLETIPAVSYRGFGKED